MRKRRNSECRRLYEFPKVALNVHIARPSDTAEILIVFHVRDVMSLAQRDI